MLEFYPCKPLQIFSVISRIEIFKHIKRGNVHISVGVLYPQIPPSTAFSIQMKKNLLTHDLLGEERWPNSQRRRTRSLFLNGLLLGLFAYEYRVYICKAHQSLSGSKDQTIDNIQRTMRAYSESGSDS